jgi:dihydroflavonol-4-reductase
VVRRLLERGDDVRLTCRRRSRWDNLEDVDVETVECDVRDRTTVRRALKGVDRVFHVAGLLSMRPGDEDRVFEVNVHGTRTLFEECLRAGVERVTYTSSVSAIGPAEPGGTADERQLFTAGHLGIPYVNSKHEAEIEAFRKAAKGLPVVIVNPAFAMGRGDVYARSTGLVRTFLLGRLPAYVPGALNIVDVDDVARGHLLADEHGGVGERYILGNRNYTLDRLFADLGRISGVEPPALRLTQQAALRLAQATEATARGRAPFNAHHVRLSGQWWTYSNNKAKRELGWQPSPHEDTLEATVDWYREREGDRLVRARRQQPLPFKLAGTAFGAVTGALEATRRLWPLATT